MPAVHAEDNRAITWHRIQLLTPLAIELHRFASIPLVRGYPIPIYVYSMLQCQHALARSGTEIANALETVVDGAHPFSQRHVSATCEANAFACSQSLACPRMTV